MPILEWILVPKQFPVARDRRDVLTVSFYVKRRCAVRVFIDLRTRKWFEIVRDVGRGLLCRAEPDHRQNDYEQARCPHSMPPKAFLLCIGMQPSPPALTSVVIRPLRSLRGFECKGDISPTNVSPSS